MGAVFGEKLVWDLTVYGSEELSTGYQRVQTFEVRGTVLMICPSFQSAKCCPHCKAARIRLHPCTTFFTTSLFFNNSEGGGLQQTDPGQVKQ